MIQIEREVKVDGKGHLNMKVEPLKSDGNFGFVFQTGVPQSLLLFALEDPPKVSYIL